VNFTLAPSKSNTFSVYHYDLEDFHADVGDNPAIDKSVTSRGRRFRNTCMSCETTRPRKGYGVLQIVPLGTSFPGPVRLTN